MWHRVAVWYSCSIQVWKSPHGLQSPDNLGNMWRGEAHLLLERRMIPISFIFLNSSLTRRKLFGGSHPAWTWTRGPLVGMKTITPCFGVELANEGVVMSGTPAKSLANSLSACRGNEVQMRCCGNDAVQVDGGKIG